jgi:uncharacterized lipoprotein YehR (DUF1307 family)
MIKFLNDNKAIILWVFIAVVVVLQVKSCTDKTPPNEKLIRLEEQGKHKEEIRLRDSVYYTGELAGKDSVISVLLNRTTEKQIQYVQLKNDEKKIRPTVESYSNNELLKRANDWKPE